MHNARKLLLIGISSIAITLAGCSKPEQVAVSPSTPAPSLEAVVSNEPEAQTAQENIATETEASVQKIAKKPASIKTSSTKTSVTPTSKTSVPKTSTPTAPASTASTPTTRRISMTTANFAFSPSNISAKKGDTVILTITGKEGTHGLAIPDFKISKAITEGGTVTVQFTADKTGTFNFFCNIPCGSGHGNMRGVITVS